MHLWIFLCVGVSLVDISLGERDFCLKDSDEDCDGPTPADLVRRIHSEMAASPVITAQDAVREATLTEAFQEVSASNAPAHRVRDLFYHLPNLVLNSPCAVGKRLGGVWDSNCGYLVGDRYLCLDALYKADGEECAVVSVGADPDLAFERKMARMGCSVDVADPLLEIKDTEKLEGLGITLHKVAVAAKEGDTWIYKTGGKGLRF